MTMKFDFLSYSKSEQLALEFLSRVWESPHDLDAIDELMTEDYVITSGGKVIKGREALQSLGKGVSEPSPRSENGESRSLL